MKNQVKAAISWKWTGVLCCLLAGLFGAGAAQGSPPNSCDDGDPCTTDFLDSYTKHCAHTPFDNCVQSLRPQGTVDFGKLAIPKFQGVVAAVVYQPSARCLDSEIPFDDPINVTNLKNCAASSEVQNGLQSILSAFSSRFQCQKLELPPLSQPYEQTFSPGNPQVAIGKFTVMACQKNPVQELPQLEAMEAVVMPYGGGGADWWSGLGHCHSLGYNVVLGGTPSYSGKLPYVGLQIVDPARPGPQLVQPSKTFENFDLN